MVIVDQIPNKLAPEVLKNTNTKIIHRLLVKDDKEAVGDAMLMDDKQKNYLSALEVGNAIIFTEETEKPIHVYITQIVNTNDEEISNEVVKNNFINRCEKNQSLNESFRKHKILKLIKLYDNIVTKIPELCEQPAKTLVEGNKDYDMLNENICELENEFKISKENILKELVQRWDQINGKAILDFKNKEKKQEEILSWFSNNFFKKSDEKIPQDFSGYFLK